VFIKSKGRWIWPMISLFLLTGTVQSASAWEMIPPTESVKIAADAFDQAWRNEASRKFSEPRRIEANHTASYLLLTLLMVMLAVLFHLMVKRNHMEQRAGRIKSGLLTIYTRMWLISRWGFRY